MRVLAAISLYTYSIRFVSSSDRTRCQWSEVVEYQVQHLLYRHTDSKFE